MGQTVNPEVALREAVEQVKRQHTIDPHSVTAGDLLTVIEYLAGFVAGHNAVMHEVTDTVLQLSRTVMRLEQDLDRIKRRARRWNHDLPNQPET